MANWDFDVAPEAVVVTTTYVMRDHADVLYVSHEVDEEGSIVWQFHSGNGDYRAEVLQLVRLDELLRLDNTLHQLAQLPLGSSARRPTKNAAWTIETEN